MAGFTYWFKYQNETNSTLIKKLGQYGLISIKCRLMGKKCPWEWQDVNGTIGVPDTSLCRVASGIRLYKNICKEKLSLQKDDGFSQDEGLIEEEELLEVLEDGELEL